MKRAFRTGAALSAIFGLALSAISSAYFVPARAQADKAEKHPCESGKTRAVEFATEKGATLPAAIVSPLSSEPGDMQRGMEIVADRARGNCVACHRIAKGLNAPPGGGDGGLSDSADHGKLGSPLDGIAGRFSEAELRLIVADPEQAFPDADIAMPAYHRIKALNDLDPRCEGRPVLSPQEVEDVVAFLRSLK